MYIPGASNAEQAKCVASLVKLSTHEALRLGYPIHDARTVALNNIAFIGSGTRLVLNLLTAWGTGSEATRGGISQLLGLQGDSIEAVKDSGDAIHANAKAALNLNSQFQIENCLRNIVEAAGLKSDGGFYALAERAIKEAHLPTQRINILNTPARIRNSMHYNGVHRTPRTEPECVAIKGVDYRFVNGESITCGSVEHMSHALESAVEVLVEIIEAECFRGLPLVFEQYAWEKEELRSRNAG